MTRPYIDPRTLRGIYREIGANAFQAPRSHASHRACSRGPSGFDRFRGELFTGDELIWACFFTGLAAMLFTCGASYVWGLFL